MKHILSRALAALLLLSLCACSSSEAEVARPSPDMAPPEGTTLLRLANSHNAAHITSQACRLFADMVKRRTDGRIEIECYFDGELGDERSTIEQCQFGGLDLTRVSSGAAADYAPLMNALQMPYEYKSVEHLFAVLDGEIGQEVFDTLEPKGLVGLTYLHPGSRCFFNNRKEIHTPQDMTGLRIRVSESELMLSMMDELGAIGVGLPFNDTYSAIQSGAVDGAENNMTSYVEMSFCDVAPYWTYDNHSFMPDMLLASKQSLDRLDELDREILLTCAKEMELWHRGAWEEAETRNAKNAIKRGCTLTALTDEELKAFQDAVAPLYENSLDEEQQAILHRVQALAETESS